MEQPDGIETDQEQTMKNIKLSIVESRLPEDDRAAAFLHECLHLWHDDFKAEIPVNALEEERHRELERLLRVLTA